MVSDQYPSGAEPLPVVCLNPCSNGIWSLTVGQHMLLTGAPVLILVLMEYGLWLQEEVEKEENRCVLILVLMEYGLWPVSVRSLKRRAVGLNPCSNGIWSLTEEIMNTNREMEAGLNPCSNGIWSLTVSVGYFLPSSMVLILVLMEYGLWPGGARRPPAVIPRSLNPCSNGIWSLTKSGSIIFSVWPGTQTSAFSDLKIA